MNSSALETWGFIGALMIASAVSFVIVRFVAQGPSEGSVEYMAAMLEPPASAPPVVVRASAPSIVPQSLQATGSAALPSQSGSAAGPTSFVDTLRSGHSGRRSYDRSQLRANQ